MKESKFIRYSLLGQLGAWLIFFLINLTSELPYEEPLSSCLFALSNVLFLAASVYTHHFILLPLFHRRKRWIYLIATSSVIIVYLLIYYFIDSFIPSNFSEDDYTFWDSYAYDFLIAVLIVAVSSLYYFVEAWYHNIKKEGQLKNEKLQAELNFLKSQINPHFLFNTLNNIYSFAQTGNKKTAPMLERLSSILRFMVYDCNEDRASLSKELMAVEDLLEIHKMKNSEQRNITLGVEGVKRFHLIAPLIIVNFVENACKHSDAVSNPNGFIQVQITVDKKDKCYCEISNSIKKKTAIASKHKGVGLKNIKKRLELQYEGAYQLTEELNNGIYFLKLEIPLERK